MWLRTLIIFCSLNVIVQSESGGGRSFSSMFRSLSNPFSGSGSQRDSRCELNRNSREIINQHQQKKKNYYSNIGETFTARKSE